MSILIKGMEMPKSCWRCPLCLTVDPDTYRCMVTGDNFPAMFDAIDHIVLPCPLVPVPPHGDLIDRDALMDSDGDLWDGMWGWSGVQIANAPTIIEAEEGE